MLGHFLLPPRGRENPGNQSTTSVTQELERNIKDCVM